MLGALAGAGVPLEALAEPIGQLDLGINLRQEPVERGGLAATRIHVDVPETRTVRHLADVLALFSPLDAAVTALASDVFQRLAQAEAEVHNMTPEEVHFHEVGALDSIADVVGAAAGLVHLGLESVSASTLSLGNGTTRGAHGPLPIPVPAVLRLAAAASVPVQAGPAPFESTTPTGAALLASIVDKWEPMPAMTIHAIGLGAGSKDSDVVANALRLVVGEQL